MSYLRTTSGRFLTLAAGIAFTGGGLATLIGHATGTAIMCAALLGTIVTTIFAVAFGSEESPSHALSVLALGPWGFFLYALGLGVAMEHAPNVGYLFAAVGLLAIARAVFSGAVEPKPAFQGNHEHAHAHG